LKDAIELMGMSMAKTQRIESDTFILGSFGLQNQAAYGKEKPVSFVFGRRRSFVKLTTSTKPI
jgi:hypothetical protein